VRAKDLLDIYLRGDHPEFRAHLRQAPVIPDTVDALDALEAIKDSSVHMGLVYDEYGHFEGVVTTVDILEAIVGEFRTEEGPREPKAVRQADSSWLISGSMPIDEMADQLSIVLPPDRPFNTAAGFALEQFGHLPSIGESFENQGWRFVIADLDGRRIDKILVERMTRGRRRARSR
jgi:putative hemolysin